MRGLRRALFVPVIAVALMLGAKVAVDTRRNGAPQDIVMPVARTGAGPVRIVVLGTSLSQRAVWPERVQDLLGACLERPVEIVRMARAGASSDWGGAEARKLPALRPDLVIIEFSINDADLVDGLSLRASRDNHAALIGQVVEGGGAVVLMTTNPVGRLAALKRPFMPAYQDLYPDLARTSGAGFFDGERRWRKRPGWRAALADGVHPDPAVEAEVIAASLAQFLGRAFGRDCGQPTETP